MELEQDTEARVLAAATDEFHAKGFHGARMQEIARRAGLNQSLLHYYYRTKDRLFEAVFQRAMTQAIAPVLQILGDDQPLLDKMSRFVPAYIDQVLANPQIPGFVLEELRRNPDRLKQFMGGQTAGLFDRLRRQIDEGVAAGTLRPIDPAQFVTNLLGLSAFPFIARPLVQTLTGMDDAAYHTFLLQRREALVRFLLDALQP